MKAKVNRSLSTAGSIESPAYKEMFETTLGSSEILQTILRKFFSLPLGSLPTLDPSIPPLERKFIFMGYILHLYNEHLLNLNQRICCLYDTEKVKSLEETEKDKIIRKIPEMLAEIKVALAELEKKTPKILRKYGSGVFLTSSMCKVFFSIFRLFNNCLFTTKTAPAYLSILENVIEFYEYFGKNTFGVKFDKTGKRNYQFRKNYSHSIDCDLNNSYLDVYLTQKNLEIPVPSEEIFLKHAKTFKQMLKEFPKLVPGEKFVPRLDSRNRYFNLFDYYRALTNFYSEDSEKYFHYLAKMLDAKEDFNKVGANKGFFNMVDLTLKFETNLKHRLLLLSLTLQIIDNHLNYYQNLSEEVHLQIKSSLDWHYQGTGGMSLDGIDLLEVRKRYYSHYMETVSLLAGQQVAVFEELTKKAKLNLFLEIITIHLHGNLNYDIHDVYAELKLVIKDKQFAQIIMEQLERIDIPCYLEENIILIEASLLEIHEQTLKQAFLNAARRCNNLQRRCVDQSKMAERDKISLAANLEKEVPSETGEKEDSQQEITKPSELKKQYSEKKVEREGKKKNHRVDKKLAKNEGEKEVNLPTKGSFFNPRQAKSDSLPLFKKIPIGARVHRLFKSDNPNCKYWVCIHPMLVHQMNREHKILELNRLHRQLSEGSLGKGQGVRGIIEGDTIKWDDPSRDCRYYGLVAEEHSVRNKQTGKKVKQVLLMLTTKVEAHTKKTPNILIPPELKEKGDSKRLIF